MKLDERLSGRINTRPNAAPAQDPDEEEETMTYKERQPIRHLNEEKGVFGTAFSQGINTAASVFESTAVFHTKRED